MIVNLLVDVICGLASLIGNAMGSLPAPGWLASVSDTVNGWLSSVSGFGVWVPWALMRTVVLSVLGCFTASLLVRLIRIIISLVTGGGGSAA